MRAATRAPGALLVGAALAAIVLACSTPGILTPAVGPGTSYPCGVGGTVCNGSTQARPICCPPGFACFPIGVAVQASCEFVGDDVLGKRRGDAGDQ